MRLFVCTAVSFLVFTVTGFTAQAQRAARSPTVLLAFAHGDDETMVGSTIIRFKELGYRVFAFYVTEGEGGKIVQLKNGDLVQERADPEILRAVRKTELIEATRVYGIDGIVQMSESDLPLRDPVTDQPTRDGTKFLESGVWNTKAIREKLSSFAKTVQPDYVITMSKDLGTHGHHKAIRIITERLYDKGQLGRRTKALLAIEETHWVRDGEKEKRGARLEFNSLSRPAGSKRTYAELAFAAASMHQSQWVAYTGPLNHAEVLYTIRGQPEELYQAVTAKTHGPSRCLSLFRK
jgi:LmbE family N-acetylglucosaminyl deacetylase